MNRDFIFPDGGGNGYFGDVLFILAWIGYEWNGVFTPKDFSVTGRDSSGNYQFTVLKSLGVVFYTVEAQTPSYWLKIKKTSESNSNAYQKITNGMRYDFQAGVSYVVSFDRNSTGDSKNIILYANSK